MNVQISADMTQFKSSIEELAARLKALDPAESLFCRIRSNIEQSLSVPSDELICLEGGAAAGTDKILIKIKLGPVLENHLVTLRAMQGDILRHGDSPG